MRGRWLRIRWGGFGRTRGRLACGGLQVDNRQEGDMITIGGRVLGVVVWEPWGHFCPPSRRLRELLEGGPGVLPHVLTGE